jgi:hypothetical protein
VRVRDGDKQALAYLYFENEPGRRSSPALNHPADRSEYDGG